MDFAALKKRFMAPSEGDGASFALPEALIEIEPQFVLGARLDGSRGSVRRLGVRPMEAPVVEPLIARQNILNFAELERALAGVIEVIGNGGDSLGVLVPDAAVRVAVLSFESLPNHPSEVRGLATWKMKDLLPFAPEEARLSYQILTQGEKHAELLAVAARRAVLSEYESALEPFNSGLILLLPSTLAILPLLPESAEGQMLLHVSGGGVTTVVVESKRLRLWRHQRLPGAALEPSPEALQAEAARVLASAKDRLLVEIRRAWLCSRPPLPSELLQKMSQGLGCDIVPLIPEAKAASSLPAREQELYAQFGAPIAGVMENAP